jgi:DNA-binding NarL/FixJ family response regulator
VRSVLVCVRTSLAAQAVASCAARLGLTGTVRTAMSEAEVMARLTERPADVVLVDTALTRPDSAGFTRRVLARSPGAVIVLFGAEDPRVAAAAVGAGARALIRGTEDLVSTVAKALLLLGMPVRPMAARARDPLTVTEASALPAASRTAPGAARPGNVHPALSRGPLVPGAPAAGPEAGEGRTDLYGDPSGGGVSAAGGRPGAATVVPAQRVDVGEAGADSAGRLVRPGAAEPAGLGPNGMPASAARRVMLTERELQVLRGMADGKSNAEIGRDLFVSEDTVKTHARRLFRKLGARDRAHAVAAGFRAGLVA